MHAYNLVQLAALAAAHGPVLVRGAERVSAASLEQYWVASKCRLDGWCRTLKRYSQIAPGASASWRRAQWPWTRALFEEVLTGEMLTRVWAAVLTTFDRARGSDDAEPIVRSVLIGHLEARHRVLTMLVRGPGIETEQAVQLNHLRRRAERWTDLFVGQLGGLGEVGEFAFDPQRAADFVPNASGGRGPAGQARWPLLVASLRGAFRRALSPVAISPELNERIAAAVLACFPPELFDSTGVMKSLWMVRLAHLADDTQGLLSELLAPEPARRPLQQVRRFRA